jgi:hypothetical protein
MSGAGQTGTFQYFMNFWVGTFVSIRGVPMPEYRFYPIKRDGHVAAPPVERDCQNDGEALKGARQLVNGHDIEVWQSSRLVAYLTPDDK